MDSPRCPGQDMRYWKPEDIFCIACPTCDAEIEFWKDEPLRVCGECRTEVRNPRLDLGCAEWCRRGDECRGGTDAALVDRLIAEMKTVFGDRKELIDHTLEVLAYAERLLQAESGDARVVRAAAALHDIGVPEALRRHGSKSGLFQEREGPPIAEAILEKHGVERETIEHISRIIGSHHSGADIDTPEFRVVWDADELANFPRLHGALSPEARVEVIEETFRTATGRALARDMFTTPAA